MDHLICQLPSTAHEEVIAPVTNNSFSASPLLYHVSVLKVLFHIMSLPYNQHTGHHLNLNFKQHIIFRYEFVTNVAWDILILTNYSCLPEI